MDRDNSSVTAASFARPGAGPLAAVDRTATAAGPLEPIAFSLRRFAIAAGGVFITIFAATWIWASVGRMWFMGPEYPMWMAKSEMIRGCDHGETMILGNSRAMAGLVPEVIGNRVVSFALGGGSPIEAYFIAKRIVGCARPPQRVIISFSLLQFTQRHFYWLRSAPFKFFSFQEMEQVRLDSERLGDTSVYSKPDLFGAIGVVRNFSYEASFPSYNFAAMLNAKFIGRKERNDAVWELIRRDRGYHHFGTRARMDWPGPEADLVAFKPAPIMTEYFEKTIALLREHGVAVQYVAMPINELTAKGMRPLLREAFEKYLEGLRARKGNFEIIGEIFTTLPPGYFGDLEHLNRSGAIVWSRELANKLTHLEDNKPIRTSVRVQVFDALPIIFEGA